MCMNSSYNIRLSRFIYRVIHRVVHRNPLQTCLGSTIRETYRLSCCLVGSGIGNLAVVLRREFCYFLVDRDTQCRVRGNVGIHGGLHEGDTGYDFGAFCMGPGVLCCVRRKLSFSPPTVAVILTEIVELHARMFWDCRKCNETDNKIDDSSYAPAEWDSEPPSLG
ncbi:hypothetical protein C8F01DRAFT_1167311 [Mycena amicta]|nr:hypothetical protein C8F01DRAFT_1167311 [Mycena amicta]